MLPRNSDIVRVNYDTCLAGAGNQGSSGVTRIEVMLYGHHYRIWQSGTITRIAIYIASLTNVTEFHIRIWRKIGTTYFLIYDSGNLLALLTAGQINTIDLPIPMTGAREGDVATWLMLTSAPSNGNLRTRTTQTNAGSYYYSGAEANPVAFENTSFVNGYIVPIELYMQAPHLVAIGDSIISGSQDHWGYADTSVTIAQNNEFNRPFSTIMNCLNLHLGGTLVYQNMGIGSQTSTQIAARYAADVIAKAPRYTLLQMGINDIITSTAESVFLANYTAILDADAAAGIISIVTGIIPNNRFTDAQYISRAAWNADLQALVATYSTAKYINLDTWIGVNRPAGPAGNLEAINPLYTIGDTGGGGSLHLGILGNYQVAKAIARKMGWIRSASRSAL